MTVSSEAQDSQNPSALDALLAEGEDIPTAVVRTIREPLLILDSALRVQAANPAFYTTFQAAPEETLGVPLFELGDGQWDIPALRQLLKEILPRDTTVQDFEVPGFGDRIMLVNARRLERQDPERELILLAVEDVTARRRAEEDLRRSNLELERFAYVASHDLQEPLRMVASYTELLAHRYGGQLDERADKYIGYAVDGARRMKALIQDLLEYSRVGTQGNPPEPTDPEASLQEVLEGLQVAIRGSGAKITHDPLPTVMVDPVQLRQLLQNLIQNAIKFSGDAPPMIHVSGRRVLGECFFSVRDQGVGIDPEYRDRIFVIFQRLVGSESEGTGIGLALSKKIVERHGGRIWVESRPGEGSTFHFTLPAPQEEA